MLKMKRQGLNGTAFFIQYDDEYGLKYGMYELN